MECAEGLRHSEAKHAKRDATCRNSTGNSTKIRKHEKTWTSYDFMTQQVQHRTRRRAQHLDIDDARQNVPLSIGGHQRLWHKLYSLEDGVGAETLADFSNSCCNHL